MNVKKILIISLIVVVSTGIGVGGTITAQNMNLFGKSDKVTKKAPEKDGPLVPIGEFTLNLQGESFLKTTITLEGVDSDAEVVLKEKDALLKDKVISVLANKSLSDVQSGEAREKLRRELLDKLNDISDNKIKKVLFASFVYQ